MSAAYLFLDVDGVLNPERLDCTKLDSTFRKHTIGGYRVWLADSHGQWLSSLRYRGITIVWATTWIGAPEMLDILAKRLGLPTDLPRITGIDAEDIRESGKRRFVGRWLQDNKIHPGKVPCVWVDDMHGRMDRTWAHDMDIWPVTVDPRRGLSDQRVIKTIEVGLGLDCHCDSEDT